MNFETEIDDIFKNLKKPNKKKVNSKRKGNSSELKICKILTNRFDKEFNRVPNSGAYGSTHKLSQQMTVAMAGDIIAPENFIFVIENKAGYKIEFLNIFKNEHTHKKLLFSFIEQASKDAVRSNKIPLIIYTKDRCQTVCIFPLNNNPKNSIIEESLNNATKFLINYQPSTGKWNEWIIISLEDFLNFDDDYYFE